MKNLFVQYALSKFIQNSIFTDVPDTKIISYNVQNNLYEKKSFP